MNRFDDVEFSSICKKFKAKPCSSTIDIDCESVYYFNNIKRMVKEDRRGEVVFSVLRPSGKVILVTCKEYPPGTYRIPTGGIKYGEDIIEAVYRETKEELGLEVEIINFLGVLKIKFIFGEEYEMFYSYLFILKEIGGILLEDAYDDEISEVLEADPALFRNVLQSLKEINKKWRDWGRFRYETSKAIYDYLTKSENGFYKDGAFL